MKKDKKFLIELEKCLEGVSSKNKKNILEKYENIIKEEKDKKKRITVILKEIGDPRDVAASEKQLLSKEQFKFKLKENINSFTKKLKRNKSETGKKNPKQEKKKKENVEKVEEIKETEEVVK